MSLFTIFTKISNYGVFLSPFTDPVITASTIAKKSVSSNIINHIANKFFITYFSSDGARLNRYYWFLLNRKKIYKVEYNFLNFFVYNSGAMRGASSAIQAMICALKEDRSVFFLCDKKTERDFNFSKLNFLFWPKKLYPTLSNFSNLDFYYNDRAKSNFTNFVGPRGVDLVVFCAEEYERINPTIFNFIAKVSIGVCPPNTRPDIFDYFIPVSTNYAITVQWVISTVLLAESINKTF